VLLECGAAAAGAVAAGAVAAAGDFAAGAAAGAVVIARLVAAAEAAPSDWLAEVAEGARYQVNGADMRRLPPSLPPAPAAPP